MLFLLSVPIIFQNIAFFIVGSYEWHVNKLLLFFVFGFYEWHISNHCYICFSLSVPMSGTFQLVATFVVSIFGSNEWHTQNYSWYFCCCFFSVPMTGV